MSTTDQQQNDAASQAQPGRVPNAAPGAQPPGPAPGEDYETEIRSLKGEAGDYRKRLRAAEAALEEMRTKAEQADQARLAEQGEWKRLAETRAGELETAKAREASLVASVRRGNAKAAVLAALSGAGIPAAQQPHLAELAVHTVTFEYDEDHKPTGDLAALIAPVLEAFKPAEKPAPAPPPANAQPAIPLWGAITPAPRANGSVSPPDYQAVGAAALARARSGKQ